MNLLVKLRDGYFYSSDSYSCKSVGPVHVLKEIPDLPFKNYYHCCQNSNNII